jgi:hypothetical protein
MCRKEAKESRYWLRLVMTAGREHKRMTKESSLPRPQN